MLGFLPLALSLLQAPAPAVPAAETPYSHVLLVSVDGLRADALQSPHLEGLPGFQQLLTGAHTLNARPDPDDTRTLPNHVGMLTGRPKLGPDGHHWDTNASPPLDLEVHDLRGDRTAGVFQVLTDHKLLGAIFASKEKFYLFPRSWQGSDADRGTPAGVVDLLHYSQNPALQIEAVQGFLAARAARGERSFSMLHLAGLDVAGHAHGWSMSPESGYMTAVHTVDRTIHGLLTHLAENADTLGQVAVVLTTDHGGGVPFKNHHSYGRAHTNYTIPFAVWTTDGRAHGDLYALNKDHLAAPGLRDPRLDTPGLPPLRNLDAGNLCLDLLGLPAIPGSTVGAHQELRIAPSPVSTDDE